MAEGPRIYNLFPTLVGSVDAWTKQLDRIAGMGFDWIFLNPIHRPGGSGSLYAVKDYYALNPVFQGRSKKAADKLIAGFLKEAEKRGIRVMMDLVINHTGNDSVLADEHPEWFVREPDGSLAAPFALDPGGSGEKTVWGDLAEIDWSERPQRQEIIDYFAELVRHSMSLGFRGFRCDAAYKVPNAVWRALIDAGRKVDDGVEFASENLGSMMEQVLELRGAGFDYLFNSSKWWDYRQEWLLEQYEKFRTIAPSIAFPETHDTERLVAELEAAGVTDRDALEWRCKQAYLFAAVFSTGVMIPIGFEYGFRKRLHVVETRPNDWEEPIFDISAFIGEVNRMRAAVPVLNEEGPQKRIFMSDDRVVCLLRRRLRGDDWSVSFLNSDHEQDVTARIENLDQDITGGREITPGRDDGGFAPGEEIALKPGEVRVFVKA
ncbi:MAG: alpha-amylase [Rhodospirillales bacterium]|nr:alpha-amylase [Rhodospirillales bacterium]